MKTIKCYAILVFAFLSFATHSNALTLDYDLYSGQAMDYGSEINVPDILTAIATDGYDIGDHLYTWEEEKDSSGTSTGSYVEFGFLSGSYYANNVVFEESGDPTGLTINYAGDPAPVAADPTYLLVKDGSADPNWFLYDLYDLGWNGTDQIILQNFWADIKGNISHVSLYGTAPVPEPTTMLLLGTGLIGLAVTGRKKFKK